MEDYKALCAAVTISAILVDIQTDMQTVMIYSDVNFPSVSQSSFIKIYT